MKLEIKRKRIYLFVYFLLSIVIATIGVGIIGIPLFIIQFSNSNLRFLETTVPVFIVLVVFFYIYFNSQKLTLTEECLEIGNFLNQSLIHWKDVEFFEVIKGDTSQPQEYWLRSIPAMYSFFYERLSILLYHRGGMKIYRKELVLDQYTNQNEIIRFFEKKIVKRENPDKVIAEYNKTQNNYILLKAVASLFLVGVSIWLYMNNYQYNVIPIPLSLILLVLWWSDVPKIWKK